MDLKNISPICPYFSEELSLFPKPAEDYTVLGYLANRVFNSVNSPPTKESGSIAENLYILFSEYIEPSANRKFLEDTYVSLSSKLPFSFASDIHKISRKPNMCVRYEENGSTVSAEAFFSVPSEPRNVAAPWLIYKKVISDKGNKPIYFAKVTCDYANECWGDVITHGETTFRYKSERSETGELKERIYSFGQDITKISADGKPILIEKFLETPKFKSQDQYTVAIVGGVIALGLIYKGCQTAYNIWQNKKIESIVDKKQKNMKKEIIKMMACFSTAIGIVIGSHYYYSL